MSDEDIKHLIGSGNRFIVTPTYSNIILYTLVKKGNELLAHIRPSSQHVSIGYCGKVEVLDHHVENGQLSVYETILNGGLRELNEEVTLANRQFVKEDITLIGTIVGGLTCIVAYVKVTEEDNATVVEPENLGLGFKSMEDILLNSDHPVDHWSREIILSLSSSVVSLESKSCVWKDIPGYSGYMASSNGEIKNKKTGHISKGGNAGRYLKVSVYRDGEERPHLEYLHILICKAFKGLGKEGEVVLHLDDDRSNVKSNNLNWGSQSDNVKSAYDNGLVAGKGSNRK